MSRSWFSLGSLVLAATVLLVPNTRAVDPEADEKILKEALGSTAPEKVLGYLREQTLSEAAREKYLPLIQQLGDRAFRKREEASKKLIEAGPVVMPLLREATNSSDREISSRARRCLSEMESSPKRDLPLIAARYLVRLRHEKAVEALMAYIPTVEEETYRNELLQGLLIVGVSGKYAHPMLVKCLDDSQSGKRALAVQLLLHCEDPAIRKKIRERLKDPDPAVRFPVALSLAQKADRDAVPVLIDLIQESKNTSVWQQAEETLYALGGDNAPHVETGEGTEEDRKKIREAWSKWWKDQGSQLLLGQKEEYPTDVAVVADTEGRVWEWKPEGSPRFDLSDFSMPVDAHVLPGRRVLIADQSGRRVTERDFTGKVLWEKVCEDGPVTIQRLANGNTYIATLQRVLEVRRDGQEVYSYPVPIDDMLCDSNRLADGTIGIITYRGTFIVMTPTGKVLLTKEMGGRGSVEALPNGHFFVSLVNSQAVVEIDTNGEITWEAKVPGMWFGTRTPDGGAIIALKNGKKMVKVDDKGKILWEKDIDGSPHAIHWK
ncbi:MAG TPA: HEAT repeat domain-containing protein [Gemmataceae bacterium]|jgi:HEAT repeat protein|nr:HEAT repeat domain-containing protein [Gemmataceae bacterium]